MCSFSSNQVPIFFFLGGGGGGGDLGGRLRVRNSAPIVGCFIILQTLRRSEVVNISAF